MLLTRSVLLCRPVASLSALSPQRRLLHLDGKEASEFLKHRVKVISTPSAHRDSARHGIAILLHADRRAQSPPSDLSNMGKMTSFFGPSLIACSSGSLNSDRSGLGKGDLGILKVQRDTPRQVHQLPISLDKGLKQNDAHQFLAQIVPNVASSQSGALKTGAGMLQQLWTIYKECEGVWFSLELSFDGNNVELRNPFLEFDDFAVHRVKPLESAHLRAKEERDANTAQAEDGGLFYIKLHNGGKVGSFGYGAGNAMATMDGLAMAGATPANFLDGGGGASIANSKLAIETLHRDPDVRSIFVNTFGGLTRCSLVVEGIIQAVKENNIKTPMTIRVMGTESDEAKELLRASGLPFTIEDDFKTAAKLAVSHAL